jgi:hypothetical protein
MEWVVIWGIPAGGGGGGGCDPAGERQRWGSMVLERVGGGGHVFIGLQLPFSSGE